MSNEGLSKARLGRMHAVSNHWSYPQITQITQIRNHTQGR